MCINILHALGYLYYDSTGKAHSEDDSDRHCQPIVFPRCDTHAVTDSTTGQCVSSASDVDCSSKCLIPAGNTGEYDFELSSYVFLNHALIYFD